MIKRFCLTYSFFSFYFAPFKDIFSSFFFSLIVALQVLFLFMTIQLFFNRAKFFRFFFLYTCILFCWGTLQLFRLLCNSICVDIYDNTSSFSCVQILSLPCTKKKNYNYMLTYPVPPFNYFSIVIN